VIRFAGMPPAKPKAVTARAILAEAALGVKPVTVNRRGRPNSGNALTAAEKQRAYRARRAAANAAPKAA